MAAIDDELGFGFGRFAARHFPFFGGLAQDEEEQLDRCLVAREMASGTDSATRLGVQRLALGRNRRPVSAGRARRPR